MKINTHIGRYAPSPTGRMHLGNVFTALLSWLSTRSKNGKWVLRIEDLDPQRSKTEYTAMIEDDLQWLGLDWDEGGTANSGNNGPYNQSARNHIYQSFLEQIYNKRLLYPCSCRRSDILATQAPHQSDGRIVYAGTCRPATEPPFPVFPLKGNTVRVWTPDEEMHFTDIICGEQNGNLAVNCGDFILRRADGAWAYQLAVVVDDAMMEITEVVRGNDLLLSTFQQLYLYKLLGLTAPKFAHIPLICNANGQRLSKRDNSLSMETLRREYKPERIIGHLAHLCGLTESAYMISAQNLIEIFDWRKIKRQNKIILQ